MLFRSDFRWGYRRNVRKEYKEVIMLLLKKFREKRIEEIIERVNKKNLVKRYTMLLTGCLIVAFAFNLFFLR